MRKTWKLGHNRIHCNYYITDLFKKYANRWTALLTVASCNCFCHICYESSNKIYLVLPFLPQDRPLCSCFWRKCHKNWKVSVLFHPETLPITKIPNLNYTPSTVSTRQHEVPTALNTTNSMVSSKIGNKNDSYCHLNLVTSNMTAVVLLLTIIHFLWLNQQHNRPFESKVYILVD